MFKRLKSHKMITLVIVLVVILFGFQILSKPEVDTNSYVTLVKGTAVLNNSPLELKNKKILKENDIIKTGNTSSIVIIEWGEGSITRLGENTEIKINKNQISSDLTKIEIFFNLLGDSGKTWSNVVSFIGEESYFKQGFTDTEAAVRGTIFEVNLDKNYLFVEKHEVRLVNLKNNKEYIVGEDKPFDISKFNFIAIQKFLLEFKDESWEKINRMLDKEFYGSLKKAINESVGQLNDLTGFENIDFNGLSNLEKTKSYNKLLSSYQKLKPSSISPHDDELYKLKLQYQETLLELAPVEDKKNILRTSIYDLKEAINSKNLDNFKAIIKLLGKNKDFINFDDLDKVFEQLGLKDSFKKSLNGLLNNFSQNKFKEFFGDGFSDFGKTIFNSVDKIDDLSKNLGEKLGDLTNNIFNK